MRQLALFSIEIYKRYISPYKGFCCAYRAHTGCQSCSTLGYRAIRRFGVVGGIALLQQRFEKCGVAHQRHHLPRQRGALRSQRGDCDPGCSGCDMPDIDCPNFEFPKRLCNSSCCFDCGSCDCGDWRRDRKQKKARKQAYIPPQRSRNNESRQP